LNVEIITNVFLSSCHDTWCICSRELLRRLIIIMNLLMTLWLPGLLLYPLIFLTHKTAFHMSIWSFSSSTLLSSVSLVFNLLLLWLHFHPLSYWNETEELLLSIPCSLEIRLERSRSSNTSSWLKPLKTKHVVLIL